MAKKKNSEKKAETVETVSQDEAEQMIESGEAEIPAEAIVESSSSKSDFAKHPKFDKFKKSGGISK